MRRILCFIGEITAEYQRGLCQALLEDAVEHGDLIEFFVNHQAYGASALYGTIEKDIMRIPDITKYDGILVCADTLAITSMAEELFEYLKQSATCPVVYIRDACSDFYNVLVDDYHAICNMVEHFITVHGYKKIGFMTGRMDLADATRRLNAYRDTMAKYGLAVDDSMIFEGDYWRGRGKAAVDFFLKDDANRPEAIVCSNDYMAISVCEELHNRGIKIPEEICVSGFDDVDEAEACLPPLTTMYVSNSGMAKNAMNLLRDLWAGKKRERVSQVIPLPRYRNSCGCDAGYDMKKLRRIIREKEDYCQALRYSTYMTLNFENVDTLYDLLSTIGVYARGMCFGEIYMCICDEEERQDNQVEMVSHFTEHMILKAIIAEDNFQICEERFLRKELLPKQYREDNTPRILVTLHEKEYCIGYLVFKVQNITKINLVFQMWVFGISGAMDRIRMYSQLENMDKLRLQSYTDELTKISNRRHVEQVMRRLYERLQRTGQSFCIISLDMDGLKYINDNFGHHEGDAALCALAQILEAETPEHGTAARAGGDEFQIVFPSETEADAEDCIRGIRGQIDKYNETSDKPYPLSASIGYEYCRPRCNLLASLQAADKKMYAEKSAKKNARK